MAAPGSGADPLEFVTVTPDTATVEPTHEAMSANIPLDSPATGRHTSTRMTAAPGAGFLEQRGLGWLLELEDDDVDEDGKPRLTLMEELDIDFADIRAKLALVLWPFRTDRKLLLEKTDFWGPCFVVIAYGSVLVWGQFKVLSWLVTMWVFGSALVWLLARVLGGDTTFAQTLGVIGYSVLPLVITIVLQAFANKPVRIVLKVLGTIWCTLSASGLLASNDGLRGKRLLLLYPVFLLFVYFISLHAGV